MTQQRFAVVPDAPALGPGASASMRKSAAKQSYMLYTNFGSCMSADDDCNLGCGALGLCESRTVYTYCVKDITK